jgi:hypothetical protein
MTDQREQDDLIAFAKGFIKGKASVLDEMPDRIVTTVNVWITDLMAAAEANDRDRVNRIAGRIGARLKDEMGYLLNQRRKERDHQRG